MKNNSITINPSWAGMIANVIWGSTFLASHETLKSWGPFTSTTFRFSIAVIFLFIFLKLFNFEIQTPNSKKQWFWVFITALLGFGFLYPLQIAALQWISSGMSASLMLTAPLMVISLSTFIGEKVSSLKWFAVFVGTIGGVILVFSHNPNIGDLDLVNSYWKGIFMTLGASFCLASSTLTSRKALIHINQYSLTIWSMFIGVLVLIPFSLFEPSRTQTFNTGAFISIIYLAIIGSVLAFFLWNYALKHLPAQNLASSMHIKTPVAIFLGVAIAGENINQTLIIGTLLITAGVWISQKSNLPSSIKIKRMVGEK